MIPADDMTLDVEVVYALPERQLIVPLQVNPGTTAREAVVASGLDQHFEDLDLESCKLGIFGRVVSDERELEAGDRVELYRPLLADPKEVRRKLAAEGKTMGKTRG